MINQDYQIITELFITLYLALKLSLCFFNIAVYETCHYLKRYLDRRVWSRLKS
jgi:hypothetical protein